MFVMIVFVCVKNKRKLESVNLLVFYYTFGFFIFDLTNFKIFGFQFILALHNNKISRILFNKLK